MHDGLHYLRCHGLEFLKRLATARLVSWVYMARSVDLENEGMPFYLAERKLNDRFNPLKAKRKVLFHACVGRLVGAYQLTFFVLLSFA